MRKVVTGDQVAQIYNRDPLAFPVWRAPVYRTPGWIIALAQLCRLVFWVVRLVFRHPVVSLVLAVLGFVWSETGWLGVLLLAVWTVVVLAAWRVLWPVGFARWVAAPARNAWRAWRYRRRWASVMTISGLAPWYQGQIILPVLGKVSSTRYTRPGAGAAGVRPVGRRGRPPGREPGARVRRDALPGQDSPVWCGGVGVRPP